MDNNSQEFSNTSPLPEKIPQESMQMDFPNAIKEVIEGKRITRVEWQNPEIYGLLKEGLLEIHINNEFKAWTISDGDLMAIDWITL